MGKQTGEDILKEIRDLQSSLKERFGERLAPEVEAMIVELCKGTGKSVAEVFEEFTGSKNFRDEVRKAHI